MKRISETMTKREAEECDHVISTRKEGSGRADLYNTIRVRRRVRIEDDDWDLGDIGSWRGTRIMFGILCGATVFFTGWGIADCVATVYKFLK